MSNTQFKEMTVNIEELILTEEQVSSGQYPLNEIYDIRFGDESVGPIWQQDIKEYLQNSGHFEQRTEIKSYDKDEWVHIFEHPFFQRRKPQLVSTGVLDTEDIHYHLLIDGQKHGPYTSFEVTTMLKANEILVTDEVSIDDGASWGHLYEIEDFDRRALKSNEELPHLPTDDVFVKSGQNSSSKLQNSNDEKTNLIAGLAYIGNLRSGKAKEAQAKAMTDEYEEETQALEPVNYQDYLWKGLFAISIIGLITVFATWMNRPTENTRTPASAKQATPKKIEPIKLKPIQQTNTPSSSSKTESPRIESESRVNSRPTSFRRSKAFRQAASEKKKLTEDARYPEENDDFYYDDNTEPVQLDPIRRTLSKETIDPEFNEDEYVDEVEGDLDARENFQGEEVFNEEVEY
ncbi:hypothetical protein [Halobacteriovorax marinus]|uniref:hypothetical protein n=1 Tax=Halobacteriovorax marinus TaxID=97084 RepID=UPI003A8D2354